MRKYVIGAVAGFAAAACLQFALGSGGSPAMAQTDSSQCSREQEAANKEILRKMGMPTPDALFAMMHDDYIQHSPDSLRFMEINNVYGKKGMALLRQAMDKVGYRYGPPPAPPGAAGARPPEPPEPILVAECDLVLSMSQMALPDPQNPGKTYAAFGFDLYRIKDGKLYEHWDTMQLREPLPAYLSAPFDELGPDSPGRR